MQGSDLISRVQNFAPANANAQSKANYMVDKRHSIAEELIWKKCGELLTFFLILDMSDY